MTVLLPVCLSARRSVRALVRGKHFVHVLDLISPCAQHVPKAATRQGCQLVAGAELFSSDLDAPVRSLTPGSRMQYGRRRGSVLERPSWRRPAPAVSVTSPTCPWKDGRLLCLATVTGLYSRRLVGWSIADHMRTSLVVDALRAAGAERGCSSGALFHSDHGALHLQGVRRGVRRAGGGPVDGGRGLQRGQRGGRPLGRPGWRCPPGSAGTAPDGGTQRTGGPARSSTNSERLVRNSPPDHQVSTLTGERPRPTARPVSLREPHYAEVFVGTDRGRPGWNASTLPGVAAEPCPPRNPTIKPR
ncbi:hypothetical protein ABH917_001159 [Thermobifida halotolerans]